MNFETGFVCSNFSAVHTIQSVYLALTCLQHSDTDVSADVCPAFGTDLRLEKL